MATDNYLEKYLPFQIQTMISQSIDCILAQEYKNKFQQHENEVFVKLHKSVMNDQGIPTLKKRGFEIDGQRKILETSERNILNDAA